MNNAAIKSDSVTEARAYNALRIAQVEADRATLRCSRSCDSAALAARDAAYLFNRGEFYYAYNRALDSLSYSVGRFTARYAEAQG